MKEATFIRVFDKKDDCEVLINLSTASKIRITYFTEGQGAHKGRKFEVSYSLARNDASAKRAYHIVVGDREYTFEANPDRPVMQLLEEIYKNAIAD
jgi:hypothetical protein